MREWMRRWRSLRFLEDQSDPEPFVILEYRAPPGTQTIDNSDEFERVRRCVAEGKDPFEGRCSYAGRSERRKQATRSSKHAYGKPHEWESSKDSDDLETEERF